MRLNFGGIRGRLHALAALNAVALAIVGAIVFLGLGRIETLTRGMARDELSRVVANAGLERALAGLNSRIALLSRTCRDATGDTDWPAFLAAFEEIAQRDVDRSVAPEIARLAPVAFALMETCQRIRGTLVRLRSLDEMLFADLGALDSITARAIIEYTLARRDMSHLDQIMLLISGFRETALLAGKRIAGYVGGGPETDRRDALEMLDDLEIRLQGFVAASPEMAGARSRIVATTRIMRMQADELFVSLAAFDAALSSALAARDRIVQMTERLDQISAGRARALDADLGSAIDEAMLSLVVASLAIILLSLLWTAWIIRSAVQRPLAATLRQVEAIGRGETASAPADGRSDEWGQIQAALARMSAELAQALRAAQSASAAKSQFLAVMSHELRTPLNGIMGLAETLAGEEGEAARRRDYARIIVQSGEALLKILNDILDLSKVEAGRFALEPARFDPAGLIGEVQALFGDIASERGLVLEARWSGPPGTYVADAGRIRQMLSNLVSNALKFTAAGRIRIEGREIATTGGGRTAELEFRVVDTGPGMSREEAAQLFQPFTRLGNAASRQASGTGLGLSIVQMLARQMGGGAGVESAPGQGASFWFALRAGKLPSEARADAAAPATGPLPPALAGHVLVAEDVPANRLVIEAFLRRLGLTFESVENGHDAVARATRDAAPPSVVLMDCSMPVLDGLDATREIRRHEQESGQPRVPIVAMTAHAFAEDRARCAEAGMDDFLAKPLKFDLVAAALARHCPPRPATAAAGA
jgi:signal transduction histidine kinase/ActR/RegA family two-component response regulator